MADLVRRAQSENATLASIREAFALCSHEDKVKCYWAIAMAWGWTAPFCVDGVWYNMRKEELSNG